MRLTEDDIQALCLFRKDKRTDREREFRSRDFIIACEVVSDLLAIGLKVIDIAKGSTRLTKLIGKYVDMKSLVEHGSILPIEHSENGSSSEAPQPPTLQIVENQHADTPVGGRSQEKHRHSRQVIESATKATSVRTLPGAQQSSQPARSYPDSLPTRHSANERRYVSKVTIPSPGDLPAPSDNSPRKRQKLSNEGGLSSVPPISSFTVMTGDNGTTCTGSVGPHDRHPEGALNHQVISCDLDASIASRSLRSSGRTNNHDSHARLGIGRAAIQRQDRGESQEGRSLKMTFFSLLIIY